MSKNLEISIHEYLDDHALYTIIYEFTMSTTHMYNTHKKWLLFYCRGFVNRSVIGVGVWRFVEGGEHGGAIRDGGSTSLPSFRSRNGGETLRAAIIHYMATSARLQ
jgi:hypothetical protein